MARITLRIVGLYHGCEMCYAQRNGFDASKVASVLGHSQYRER